MSEHLSSQHTATFPELLNQAGMSIVVSTYQAGKLILLRANESSLNTHFISLPKPMGVAHHNGRLSIGSGAHVIDYFNMANAAPKIEPINTHDGAFLPRRTHVTGNIDIHEMGFTDDEELWLVNTKMSCLCTLDINHSVVPRWRPPFISAYDMTDRCHLNGLAMRDGNARYVSSLGTSDTPGGWRDNKAHGGIVMDIESNEIIGEGLSMPHSPRWYRDKLWVLESGTGQLITINPLNGEKTVVGEMPGFCRGIDFIDRYAVIGLSQVRETTVFAGLPLTEREQDRKCGVWIVDIETGETAGYLVFSQGMQEIFSVQLLPWKYPALLDHDDPMIKTSYALPDFAVKEFTPPDAKQIVLEKAIQHHRRGEINQAIDAYKDILLNEPDHLMVLYQMGTAYSQLEQWDDAIACLNRVISLSPSHAEAHNSLGQAYANKLEYEKALKAYDVAIAADHKYAAAHFNRGCLLLRKADYNLGWAEYEWRWSLPNFVPFNCPQAKWLGVENGEDISEKTLLVHVERGSGDAIQFARFLPAARAKCKKLIVVCNEQLRLLFNQMDCVDEVRLPNDIPIDAFDVYCPIMSLGLALKIDQHTLGMEAPYLTINKQVVVPELSSDKLKIGLVWAGSPTQQLNHQRSCPLDDMLALTGLNSVQFYSFQKSINQQQSDALTTNNVHNLDSELVSYAHTGALLKQMDIVVSVCTSVIHLAGALGIPSYVLLSTRADWRWQNEEGQSSWYPSVNIMRQQKSGDWPELVKRLREVVAERATFL